MLTVFQFCRSATNEIKKPSTTKKTEELLSLGNDIYSKTISISITRKNWNRKKKTRASNCEKYVWTMNFKREDFARVQMNDGIIMSFKSEYWKKNSKQSKVLGPIPPTYAPSSTHPHLFLVQFRKFLHLWLVEVVAEKGWPAKDYTNLRSAFSGRGQWLKFYRTWKELLMFHGNNQQFLVIHKSMHKKKKFSPTLKQMIVDIQNYQFCVFEIFINICQLRGGSKLSPLNALLFYISKNFFLAIQ